MATPQQDADTLRKAMKGIGCDKKAIDAGACKYLNFIAIVLKKYLLFNTKAI